MNLPHWVPPCGAQCLLVPLPKKLCPINGFPSFLCHIFQSRWAVNSAHWETYWETLLFPMSGSCQHASSCLMPRREQPFFTRPFPTPSPFHNLLENP